ncbi:phosphonate ABC transporter ATP-binding protein [Paenibacillus turpanensis]|uniref:phosphonate ABC transporter ATP-binding protein n=1 Tax=Paenibacillus turpanensis TaxID=2689078 RepID=UPI00140B792F|nr:ATP-binding cassette domain-containing protein [Paenibacillus turpanensis]
MLIVRNLDKLIDERKVLDHISFQADPGEFISILGGSGSGKSTLLKCLALRDTWTNGQYIHDGNEVTSANWLSRFTFKNKIVYLEEKVQLDPNQTAISYVLSGRRTTFPLWRKITFTTPEEEYMKAMDILEHVGLLDKAKQKLGQLSGGEKQRVAIAYALAKGANIIIADEPVTGLDPHSAGKLLNDIKELCSKKSVTFICTLHQTEFAEKYASRIWGMADGKVIFDISGRRLTQGEKQRIF